MLRRIAEWHLQPSHEEARRVREALSEVLVQERVPQRDCFQLACAELIVNLSRYPNPKPTEVVMSFSKDDQFWWLELRDNGPSFNNFSQLINDTDPLEPAESGMGLKLLAQMFSDIRYVPACYRDDACNLMLLRQPIETDSYLKKTILLVDDDPSYRAVLKAYLQNAYQVIETESVAQGFSELLKYQPDLVICDIQMPEQDGPALFDQIAHIPEVASTAFIFLSGIQDEEQIGKALHRPIDDYLAKPVTRDQLIDCIDRVIQRRGFLDQHIRFELEQKVSLGLRPSLPDEIPGFNVQLRSLNPEPGGGDLVQMQQRGEQSSILMADLMGHGLSAKGYSFALAGYLRGLCAAACNQKFDLPDLFRVLSQSFDHDPILKETLATLIAVQLNPEGKLEWVNAGHPYPLKISHSSIETLQVEGALPGLGVDDYQTLNCVIQSGERVMWYSDGYWDAAEKLPCALVKAIEDSFHMPLTAAADHLLSARLHLGRADDDLTLILLEKI